MLTNLTKQDLIDFEDEIALAFNNKEIRAPVHLQDGSFDQILEIFKEIKEEHWVFSSWRSHAQNLLKNVPKDVLKQRILDGKSISLCDKDKKIFCSAIVSGSLPIALGVSMDIKRKNQNSHVWCWLGDMTSCNGMFYECLNYAVNHELPITYIIENNGKSVCTDTYEVMNTKKLPYEPDKGKENEVIKVSPWLYYYWYKLEKFQHAGTGVRVMF